jgi:predicted nucleic acid-binding protein
VSAGLLLIDDGAGRQEARRRRLPIIGTLGILGLAARHGLTDLPLAIARLRATNFRASEELIEWVLEEDAKEKRAVNTRFLRARLRKHH